MSLSPKAPNRSRQNPECDLYGQLEQGNIVMHGFFKLKRGRRRRYRCKACRQTFSFTKGTPYYRIQLSRNVFDEVCAMSVEGVNKSAISRIKRLTWNTVARWLERACAAAKFFNDRMINGLTLQELQADEIRTFFERKDHPIWIITGIEVWSRLWPSCVVGKRSFRNIRKLFRDIWSRSDFTEIPSIATDGFQPYEWVITRLFGPACVYGQVVKIRRKDRIVQVERKIITGSKHRLDEALERSEDSSTLNTSFIERHNLTIRRGCAYLQRRTPSHARCPEYLVAQLELLRCHYNFIRPHSSLKYGSKIWTPAMQAGLVSKKLTFRQIFLFEVENTVFVLLFITEIVSIRADQRIAA